MNKRPKLERRTFLKSAGALVSLPLLEAMRTDSSKVNASENKEHPVRMAFVFAPNGVIQSQWNPEGEGKKFKLNESMKPLESVKDDIVVLSGLAQDNGRPKGDGPGDHARCGSTFLTGAHPVKTSGANIRVGVSVDQLAAKHIGQFTMLSSLELGLERSRMAGNCDSGYSCAYSSNISWKTPTTPMAKEIYPRLVFERMFGSDSVDPVARKKRRFYRKSILDSVAREASQLKIRLGNTDRRKVDEYFNSIREVERQIERTEKMEEKAPPEIKLQAGIPKDFQEHARSMMDLMVISFQSDVTRVITLMLGNAGSNRVYKTAGASNGHHSLSHHQDNKEKVNQLQKIDQYLVSQYAYLIRKLKSVKEGEGTLLDQSMILYGSGLGDGNRHSHHDLPVILAGQAGKSIETGRHLKYPSKTPMNNLFLSMLDRVDAGVESIGDSTSRLPQLG
jgi:Protein of unknown function (DUF1552)